ncbi:PepSY domain-containing protein [Methylobacterium flocculans]|uniref:PepSY domain-containing protein n=1 Tax=Methylobacterium flocculans TaxID=2984843 RepID=UPI0021F3960D|nr:PepSY domain-containing protein [Methylobacterium sp. FF17]
MRALLKPLKRWLILGHRWLGIATGLFLAAWVLSGLVMLYVAFPALTEAERLSRLAPIAWDRVRLGPDAALAGTGLDPAPGGLSLSMRGSGSPPSGGRHGDSRVREPGQGAGCALSGDGPRLTPDLSVREREPGAASSGVQDTLPGGARAHRPCGEPIAQPGGAPVYQVTTRDGARHVVSAETGAVLGDIDAGEARAPFGPGATVRAVIRDQWTVRDRYDPLRPFHVVALGDAAGTELYVSARTGTVVLDTTRRERLWNWLGAIPHWFYPTPLRARADLWRGIVLWVSGVAVAGAVSGLVLGIWRLRLRRPYAGGVTPYRGLARWHHLFGVVGGVSLVSFAASGWLSMNPNHWFSPRMPPAEMRDAYAGPAAAPDGEPWGALRRPGIVEVRIARVGGRPVRVGADAKAARVVVAPPTRAAVLAAAGAALPEARLAGAETLTAYDAYWYPHHDTRPLPVLRLRFDDPAATWLHVDPESGALLDRLDASGRLQRWLFEAPHRLDFAILFQARPAWDLVMWLLNGLGAGIALTGVVLGWRRLRRGAQPRGGANPTRRSPA